MSGWVTRPGLAALAVAVAVATGAEAQDAPDAARRASPARTGVQAAMALPAPPGWLGIYYVCETETWADKGELFVKHLGYPQVASVEPGSPAFRAGIEAGDTILAYNAIDLKGRAVSLTKLLKPGTKLEVRVKRGKETHDLPVTVARRVRYGPGVTVLGPEFAVAGRRPGVVISPPSVDVILPAPRPFGRLPLAGAELARINPDLGQPFGVEKGVLVLQVLAHTPAARAGLRSGDVITAVDGVEVLTPDQVQRALARASEERSAKLSLVRKRKPLSALLVWSEP